VGGDIEALLGQLADGLGLETGEQVGLLESVLLLGGEGQVDDLEELLLVEGLNTLAEQQGLDLGVLVEVADLGNHTKTDGDARLAAAAAPLGEGVEETVGRAVVGLGGGTDSTRDGRGEQEEVELVGRVGVDQGLDGVVQVPGTLPLGVDTSVPGRVGHAGEESLVETHGSLDDTANLLASGDAGGDSSLNVLLRRDITTDDSDVGTSLLEAVDELAGALAVSTGTADEDEVAGTELHHPSAKGAAETTQAADEQVDLVVGESAEVLSRGDLCVGEKGLVNKYSGVK